MDTSLTLSPLGSRAFGSLRTVGMGGCGGEAVPVR